jgi:hypothetical protein
MPKLIALISKQPQLSPEAFQKYYEANHAPLIYRHCKASSGRQFQAV